ncbi:hypothetical protein TKK_0004767 [Trichogramma kaykai]
MVRVKTLDDFAVVASRRRKSRVSSLFHRISWCGGCGQDGSYPPSRPKSPTAQSVSSWRSAALVVSSSCPAPKEEDRHRQEQQQINDSKPLDLAAHFDLDSIKFIDEDDDEDEDDPPPPPPPPALDDAVLDSPGTKGIEDAWVIAVERSARERLQKLTELRRIKPRDIQAILHQQITEGSIASTSEEATDKDVTSSQITVTLADKEGSTTTAYVTKLSNGTVNNQGIVKDSTQDPRANQLRKQTSSLEDPDLFSPVLQVGGVRNAERRASSPFQNGRTEVLIGEPEGGPRSPRGSTSSAVNEEHDYPEPIIR